MRSQGAEVEEFSLKRALTSRHDVLHLHWPEIVFDGHPALVAHARAECALRLFDVLRARGTKIIWTVHNLRSHDQRHPRLERYFYSQLLERLSGFIALSETARTLAVSRYPSLGTLPSRVVPLGHFRGYYGPATDSVEARRSLGIAEHSFVIGSFGRIRPYKNLPELVRSFTKFGDADCRLLIAGEPARTTDLEDLQGSRVILIPEHVEERSVRPLHDAVDLVVLPYRDVFNSASAMLALSCNRPVLIPSFPTMQALQDQVGQEWVMLYDPPLTSAVLLRAREWCLSTTRPRECSLDELNWDRLAASTLDFYREMR
jgi:glycosyltransferase involved in cell wall biosynthesis